MNRSFARIFVRSAILMGLGCSGESYASDQMGPVTLYTIATAGSSAVILSGPRVKPPCAMEEAFSLRQTSPNRDLIMATVMTAKANGRTLHIVGTGSCDPDFPVGREEIAWVIAY